ncbi:MAG: acyl-CoA dehydrogenase family protein [Oligoflexales bacterium]|nr:acyl-CoA dehydrogenase family protein [Oligoflexales bacterium]
MKKQIGENILTNVFENEEHRILRQSIRQFAEKEIAPIAIELDQNEEFSVEITKKMCEIGLFGTIVDPSYGGQGMDYLSYIIAVEELARIDGSQAATIAAHNSLGCGPIYYFGSEDQKRRFLPDICEKPGLWAFGLSESEAGSDAQSTKTTATFDEKRREWVINGSKMWITNASCELTKGITVQAITGKRTDGKNELSCFLIPIDTPGITTRTLKNKLMWRASNTAELYFDGVRIPEKFMLGKRGQGFSIMMKTLDNGRLSIAAMGLGLSKGAFKLAMGYSKERITFGVPIFEHQAIAFKLAEMATRIEAAETLLYKACWMRQNEMPFGREAAMAKLYCSEVAEFCAREGQQIFGGYGLMKEFHIERHYRDATLLRIGEGTNEILKLVIARYLGH